MNHTISVITHHIAYGVRRDPELCPLSLALVQHFGRPVKVATTFFWFEDGFSTHINLPTIAIRFQRDFDRGFRTLEPFTFNIERA